jgi:hypothetical protein
MYLQKGGIPFRHKGNYPGPLGVVKKNNSPSFLNSIGNPVVHEQVLDGWEFGKGALSANVYFCDNHSEVTRAAANPVLG